MVRHDTSDSNMKTIHLKSRKTVDIWNKWRNRGENLSETIANFLIQEEERQQEIAKANGQVLDEEGEEQQQNRVRPPFDFSFVVDSRHYRDERRWMNLYKYAKDQEILDLHEMLEYAIKRSAWKANMVRAAQKAQAARAYKEEREREWEQEQEAQAANAAQVLPAPPASPPPTAPTPPAPAKAAAPLVEESSSLTPEEREELELKRRRDAAIAAIKKANR